MTMIIRALALARDVHSFPYYGNGGTSMKWHPLFLTLALAAAGCNQQTPTENAGERIDTAVDDLRDGADELRDQERELIDETAERLERPRATQ
jgi:hypothetical protein